MKFLGLIYIDEDKLNTTSAAECLGYAESLRSSGRCLAAEALVCCDPAGRIELRPILDVQLEGARQ